MDVPAPGVGAMCGSCPQGYTGDASKCYGINTELALLSLFSEIYNTPLHTHTHTNGWLFLPLQISTNAQIMLHFVGKYVLILMVVISVLVWMGLISLRDLTSAEVTDCIHYFFNLNADLCRC